MRREDEEEDKKGQQLQKKREASRCMVRRGEYAGSKRKDLRNKTGSFRDSNPGCHSQSPSCKLVEQRLYHAPAAMHAPVIIFLSLAFFDGGGEQRNSSPGNVELAVEHWFVPLRVSLHTTQD